MSRQEWSRLRVWCLRRFSTLTSAYQKRWSQGIVDHTADYEYYQMARAVQKFNRLLGQE